MIASTAHGKFWIAAIAGALLLAPHPGLASEQRPRDPVPDGFLLQEGEPKPRPTLATKPWLLPLHQSGLENPSSLAEAANDLDTGLVNPPRDQPHQPEFEANADDLASPHPIPFATSTAAADLAGSTMGLAQAWPLAQAPTPDSVPSADPAQEEAAMVTDLAAAAQNPIANLISLPFQNNTNFGVGPNNDRTQNVLNIQPVVPIPLSDDWLLVTRTILPFVAQPDFGSGGTVWGLGDLNPSFFVVPATQGNLTWGLGPTLVLPTATNRQTGTGKWSAGPAGVAVVNSGPWVYGGLMSQVWSFAGDGSRPDISQFLMQPFATRNFADGWYLTSSPIITANWNAASGNQWTVPIGGGGGRLFNIGTQPINASLQVFWNAVRPSFGADFTLRAQVQMLFPR